MFKVISEETNNAIQDIPRQLTAISGILQQRNGGSDELFSQFAKRLADVEARIQKIETLLITKTVAGKSKLTESGNEVAKRWYQ